jgi:hypothetical protein
VSGEIQGGSRLEGLQARRNSERWSSRHGIFQIGEFPCVVIDEPTWEMGHVWQVTLDVENRFMSGVIQYTDPARLAVAFDDTTESVFAGLVASVERHGATARIMLLSSMVELQEVRLGGAGFWTAVPGEVSPLIGTLVGDQASLDRSRLGAKDLVYVICPIDGIEADRTFIVGQVIFTPDGRITSLANYDGLDPALAEQFADSSCWAVVVLDGAAVDWPTTARGYHLIDSTLAWIMAAHSTGRSLLGDKTEMWFDRRWVRSRPTRRDVRLVCGDRSGQRAMQGPISSDDGPPLGDPGAHRLPHLPSNLVDEQLLYALLAWRRAMETTDRFIACSALCEAIECVVAGTEVDATFTDDDLNALRTAIPHPLDQAQSQRLNDLIAMVADGSLMMKLGAFAEQRQIEIDPADAKAFKNVRGARNRFVHGRARGEVEGADLTRTRAWVARFLLQAVMTTPLDSNGALGLLRSQGERRPGS